MHIDASSCVVAHSQYSFEIGKIFIYIYASSDCYVFFLPTMYDLWRFFSRMFVCLFVVVPFINLPGIVHSQIHESDDDLHHLAEKHIIKQSTGIMCDQGRTSRSSYFSMIRALILNISLDGKIKLEIQTLPF